VEFLLQRQVDRQQVVGLVARHRLLVAHAKPVGQRSEKLGKMQLTEDNAPATSESTEIPPCGLLLLRLGGPDGGWRRSMAFSGTSDSSESEKATTSLDFFFFVVFLPFSPSFLARLLAGLLEDTGEKRSSSPLLGERGRLPLSFLSFLPFLSFLLFLLFLLSSWTLDSLSLESRFSSNSANRAAARS